MQFYFTLQEITMAQRTHYADLLRISAAFMVVLLHVAAQYWAAVPVNSAEWFTFHAIDSAARPAVSIFVMISGMFLLDPHKEIPLGKLFSRYCKKILILLVFWSFFYATWRNVFWAMLRGYEIDWQAVLTAFQTGHYHLWYCYMLLGLYLIIPFLKKITADRTLMQYFLVLAFGFAVILPVLPFTWAKTMRQFMFFSFTLGYTGYFVLGYYFRTTVLNKTARYLCYLAGGLSLAFTVFASYQKALALNTAFGYYDPFTLNTVCLSVAVFLFYQYEIPDVLAKHETLIGRLVDYSLGIYLIHPFILAVLEHFGINALLFAPAALAVPCVAILAFVLSWIAAAVMKKIPIVKQYLC